LIVELYPQDPDRRVLTTEEGLQVEADEYIIMSGEGGAAPFPASTGPLPGWGKGYRAA
jgi:hypothetical protein